MEAERSLAFVHRQCRLQITHHRFVGNSLLQRIRHWQQMEASGARIQQGHRVLVVLHIGRTQYLKDESVGTWKSGHSMQSRNDAAEPHLLKRCPEGPVLGSKPPVLLIPLP